MKIIEPSVELINAPDYKTLLTTIEAAGRTCYKSEDKITDGSAEKFVRHRLAAFCQESTRYCNYGKEGFGG